MTMALGSLEERLNTHLNASDFSVASYLNMALNSTRSTAQDADDDDTATHRTSTGSTTTDWQQERMAQVALQLQLQTQSCHEEIGKIGAELQAIVPRCAADVGRIQVGLEGLQMSAADLLSQVHGQLYSSGSSGSTNDNNSSSSNKNSKEGDSSQPNNSSSSNNNSHTDESSLETLSQLHALQFHLREARQVLLAASQWDTSRASVAPLLLAPQNNKSNLALAVDALHDLEQGTLALQGMPGHQDRLAELQQTQSQVTALLQPQLQAALRQLGTSSSSSNTTSSSNNNNSTKPLEEMVQLYAKLGQSDELLEHYVQTTGPRHAQVRQHWFDYTPSSRTQSTTMQQQQTPKSAQDDFLAWLPGFWNVLWQALEQERLQAATIFRSSSTTTTASSSLLLLVNKLVRQCLQHLLEPLQSSMSSRLTTLCAAPPATAVVGNHNNTLANNNNNWPAIAQAYQCGVQFAVTLYESLASAWLDWAEDNNNNNHSDANNTTTTRAQQEFAEIATALQTSLIRQPFRRYLEHHVDLERAYLEEILLQHVLLEKTTERTTNNNNNMHNLANGNLDTLQLEALDHSVRNVFTEILPQAWQRWELLHGNTNNSRIVAFGDMLDDVLVQFGTKWAGLIRERLQAQTNVLDEGHVHTALSLLELVGNWEADLEQWVQNCWQQHHNNQSSVNFDNIINVLPETLSAQDTANLLARGGDDDDNDNDVSNNNNSTFFSLTRTKKMVRQKLAPAAVNLVFDVCSAVPRSHLQDLAGLPSWNANSSSNSSSDADYGILPQPYMNHVGEHMVALVQALEPFSDPKALRACQRVLTPDQQQQAHHNVVSLQPWRELVQTTGGLTLSDKMLETFQKGRNLEALTVEEAVYEEYEVDENDDDSAEAARLFGNLWLDVVASAVTGRLLERILRIPALSHRGGQQLQADLAYLANVLSALGVDGHPHVLLTHLEVLAVADASVLQDTIQKRNVDSSLEAVLKAMEERFAAIRSSY